LCNVCRSLFILLFLFFRRWYCLSFFDLKLLITTLVSSLYIRRVWRYKWGNHNPYIEEEQTTQWPKEKAQNDKQRFTKHTHRTKDWVTRTPLKTGGELLNTFVNYFNSNRKNVTDFWRGRQNGKCISKQNMLTFMFTVVFIIHQIL
jgi:hypothetical protein